MELQTIFVAHEVESTGLQPESQGGSCFRGTSPLVWNIPSPKTVFLREAGKGSTLGLDPD